MCGTWGVDTTRRKVFLGFRVQAIAMTAKTFAFFCAFEMSMNMIHRLEQNPEDNLRKIGVRF
jgi:hypothetical protein